MNTLKSQEDIDNEHLKLLKMFHYVLSGIIAFFSCGFLFHIVMGLAMVFHSPFFESAKSSSPGEFGWIFVIMGSIMLLLGWTYAAFLAYAGRCIGQRKRRLLVLVVAGIGFSNMPLGVILSVFTFLVLMRSSVKQLFDSESKQAPAATEAIHMNSLVVPDPDEEIWKEMEEKAKRQLAGNEGSNNKSGTLDDGSEVISLKKSELA